VLIKAELQALHVASSFSAPSSPSSLVSSSESPPPSSSPPDSASRASPIRAIFKQAFAAAGLPYYQPHSIRHTLAQRRAGGCPAAQRRQSRIGGEPLGHARPAGEDRALIGRDLDLRPKPVHRQPRHQGLASVRRRIQPALCINQQPLGAFVLRGGIGPAFQLAFVSVAGARETRVVGDLELALGLSRELGPGRLEFEVSGLLGRLDGTLARLDVAGLGLKVGYSFDLGGRSR
jgi:hypothetical protein